MGSKHNTHIERFSKSNNYPAAENTSGILKQTMNIKRVSKKEATHFAVCNGDKLRYLIAIYGGKQQLSRNFAAYSIKLGLLTELINYIPLSVLETAGVGYYSCVKLHPEIEEQYQKLNVDSWNLLVGTYDLKQKIVMQCYRKGEHFAKYIKIGNGVTEHEMRAEIEFLRKAHSYMSLKVPELLDFHYAGDGKLFNFQITKEFTGKKVKPGLTKEIVGVYREIAMTCENTEQDFSHGDFAPWNIKKEQERYIVFDWEYCGMRIKGFDLMHYVVVPKMILEGKNFAVSYEEGMNEIRQFIPDFKISQREFEREYKALRLR